jgi:hypothetical protein
VTWLYGPLQPVLDKPLEDLFRTDGYGQISTPRCALKKKPTLTKWRLSEIMLHKSLSAFSLLKQAAAAVHFEPSTQDTTPGPTVLPIPPRPMYKYTDGILPLLLSSGISAAREKSVRFHDQVEQFIAIDTTNDENYVVGSGSDKSAIDWDSDNNSDILEMRLKRPKFGPLSSVYETTKGGRTRKRRSKRVTIQKLPPTPLKLRSDPLETFLAARNKDRFRDFTWLRPFPLRETLLSAETLTCRRFGDNNNDKGQYIKCHSVNLPSLSDERRSEIEAWALNHLELSESKSPVTVSDADRCDITCCADREQHMGFVESLEDRDTWDNKMSIDPRRASELFENALRIVDDSERSEDFLEVCYDNLLEPLSPEERTQMLCSYPDNLSQISSNMVDSPNSITLMGAVDTLAARRSRQRKVALLKDISVDRPQNALGSHTSPVSSTPPAVAREIHMPERSLPAEGLQEIMIVTIEEHRKSELADIDPQSGTIEAGSSSPNISQYQTSESEGIGSDFSANNDHCDRIDDMYGDPENVLEEVLDPMRQTIVDRVMNEFWVLFNQTWSANITQHTGNSATVLSPSMGGMPATSQKSSGTTQRKRQRSEDEEPPDESNDKRPQQPGKGLCEGSDSGDRPRFACPFRKHNPRRYGVHSHSVCALSSWETIARVKYARRI